METIDRRTIDRVNAFDLIRGWCLIAMTSNHLIRDPSIFDPFTGRGIVWVSPAEGFFFISGTIVGIARGRMYQRDGFKATLVKLWGRALKLYLASIVLTLFYYALATVLGSFKVSHLKSGYVHFSNVWQLIFHAATFRYFYGWADFLIYYAVFLFIAPFLLWLLRHRLWWLICIVVVATWSLKSVLMLPYATSFLVWQTYFFLGLVFGYHFSDLQQWYRKLTPRFVRVARRSVFIITALTITASYLVVFGPKFLLHNSFWFSHILSALDAPSSRQLGTVLTNLKTSPTYLFLLNNRAGVARLPLFACWFGTLFYIVRRYEVNLIKGVGWLLLPLGRNSLYVYIISSAIAFTVPLLNIAPAFVINTVINLAAVTILWICVRSRFLFKIIPR